MNANEAESGDPLDGDNDEGELGSSADLAPQRVAPVEAPTRLALPADAAGKRLDAWLAAHAPEYSRVQVKRMIEDGHVTWSVPPRNGAKIKASYLIQGGEELSMRAPAPRSQVVAGEAIPLALLHEDADVAVVNKPAGLVVHPGAGTPSGTLANALVGRYGALAGSAADRPGIVHRLDKETSGVIVAARNEKSLRKLMAQFEARTVRKVYLALVHCAPQGGGHGGEAGDAVEPPDEFIVEASIGRHATQRALMAIQPPGQGRGALTRFRTVARFREPAGLAMGSKKPQVPQAFALVACYPKTGRTHQLRVHLKSVERPILADGMYGPATQYPPKPAAALIDRQALHAFALAFDHPVTGKRLRFCASVPADMAAVLDAWSKPVNFDWRAAVAEVFKTMPE